MFHMVVYVEYVVRVDRQGRLVIPAPIRKRLGLDGGGKVILRVEGSRIIIEVLDEGLMERVDRWMRLALSLRSEVMVEGVTKSWRWMGCEYAERKLGLR